MRKLGNEVKLQSRRRTQSQIDGDLATRFRGRGMEFSEVRPYNAGDDIRNIDWRVTARTQVTHTKLFQEERERPVILLIDQRSPMFFGTQTVFKSVFAAELACCIAWAAQANNDRIGALIFSDSDVKDIRPKRGSHALLNIIHHLHAFNHQLKSPHALQHSTSLSEQLEDLSRIAKPGSAIYIISDFHDFDVENRGSVEKPSYHHRALVALSKHNDVNLFKVFDPLEASLPNNQLCTFSNGRERLQISTRARSAKHYQTTFERQLDIVRQSARQSSAYFAHTDVSVPIESTLKKLFVVGKNRRGLKS